MIINKHMLKTLFRLKSLPFYLTLLSLALFLITLQITRTQIGIPSFTEHDFFWIALFPALIGLLFIFLGVGFFLYLFPRPGLVPLFLFHFFVGNFLILFSKNYLPFYFTYLSFFCLAFIPPTLIHFTFLISEMFVSVKKRNALFFVTYCVGVLIAVLYLYFLIKDPTLRTYRTFLNNALLTYLVLAYFFWISRLIWIYKKPYLEFDRIFARYLLIGQLVGFILPLGLVGLLVFEGISLPLNLASPLILLFPISLWIGIVPGERQRSQTYLIQSEKRVALGDLLAGLAHELNNPLTFVYSSIEPLSESLEYLKSVIQEPTEKTAKVFKHLDKMVANMRDGMTRAENLIKKFRDLPSKKRAEKEEIDLNLLIDKTIELLEPKWKDRIQIEKSFEELPKILGLTGELEQAFTNLLANSMEATPDGGVVQVSTHEAANGVKIMIRDTGKGIPKEVIGRIFDPFFTTKEQGEGMGLGLAITLQIIKNHRGSIEVKSEEGKGTKFVVFLPYG
jgi:signal transduction histidine kinase